MIEELIFGPGFCKRCGLLKPLVMIEAPGLSENKETGELDGESFVSFVPEGRQGYCETCAIEVIKEGQRKQ